MVDRLGNIERKKKPSVEPKPWDYLGFQGEQPTIDDLQTSATVKKIEALHQQLEGAIEERDRLRSFVADFLCWRTTADLNRLAEEARSISDQWGQ